MTARTTDAQALLKPSPKTMPARSRQGISRLQTTELILCYSELPVHLLALRRYCIAINLWERKHRKVSGRQQRYCITGELTAIVTVIDSLVKKKHENKTIQDHVAMQLTSSASFKNYNHTHVAR